MLVCFSAARHRSELLAKAIIAAEVRIRIRGLKEKKFPKPNGRLVTTTQATELSIARTADEMIVDHACGLHECVADR